MNATSPSGLRRRTAAREWRHVAGGLAFAVGLLFTSGCDRVSAEQARQLVARYNQVVSEAYRCGDIRLIDPVVGPNEGRKLTGLIGVRRDLGLLLDSHLLTLDIAAVTQTRDELRVRTREFWSYQDLKIASGQPVGSVAQDRYEMIYVFRRADREWLVDEIKFATPPQVGRTNPAWVADRSLLHGVVRKEAQP